MARPIIFVALVWVKLVAGSVNETQEFSILNKGHVERSASASLRQYSCGNTSPVFVAPGYQGRFRSPSFSNQYGGADCIWIMTTSSDAKFSLKCDPFSIPCQTDYMIISPTGDSAFQDASKPICGTGKFEVNSTKNAIAIYYYSPYYDISSRGFSCVGQAISTSPSTTTRPTTTTRQPPYIPPLSCDCGIKGTTRIVGGEPTDTNEYPWQVGIADISIGGGSDLFCGGTLISNYWILTAAHCTYGRTTTNLAAFMGENGKKPFSFTAQVRKIVQIIQHPLFNRTTVDNDIALLKLESPVFFSHAVRSACLPSRFASYDFDYQTGVITGWGTTSFGGATTDVLYEVVVPILSTTRCRQNPHVGSKITNNMFCTYADNKDACQGDSGGPLNWVDPYTGRVVVIGITSWGIGCARPNTPGVYTKVTNYLSWIQQYTGK